MNQERRFAYKDYVEWPEDERWELLRGEPFKMAAPTTTHQDWVGEVFFQLKSQLAGRSCKAYIAPVDLLPYQGSSDALDSADTVLQPDVLVICDPALDRSKALVGAPTFVLEVQSVSTAFRDQTDKLQVYQEVGVREYLILNPVNLALWAYRLQPDGRYGKPEVWTERTKVALSSLSGVCLDFTVAP